MANTISGKFVVLLGGGTGGHIFPLLSLREELESRKISSVFMGERGDTLEHKIALQNNIPFIGIYSGKLRRYFSIRTFAVPFLILAGFCKSFWYFLLHRPLFVFSKWGYVSLPAAVAAWVLRIPVYMHESDAVPGLSNRIVGMFSKKVFLGFQEAAKFFSHEKTEVVGQILSKSVLTAPYSWKPIFPENSPKPRLLVVCGSLGSARVFDAVVSLWEQIAKDFEVVITLWTLNTSYREKFEKFGFRVFDFLSQAEMMQAYREADIAITRAGATTLWELEAFGVQMIIVPLVGSAWNHQYYNAVSYQKKGAYLVSEDSLPDGITNPLLQFQNSPKVPPKIKCFWAEKILSSILRV